jgi:predicted alpha/beta-fold hydrolase
MLSFLLGGLIKYVEDNLTHLSGRASKIDIAAVLKSKTVKEFDHNAVVPAHGFRDVDHYYVESSAYRVAANIFSPTLSISADDDPVCSSEGCPRNSDEIGPGLVVARVCVGGHVGFSNSRIIGTSSWMDDVAVEWCRLFFSAEANTQ